MPGEGQLGFSPGLKGKNMQFSPSIYEHAARVIDRNIWEVSRDQDLLAKGNIKAFELYEHEPVVVGIDIYNLEAEAYGATVARPGGNGIPAIVDHPYSSVDDILALSPFDPKTDGRISMAIAAAKQVAEACPEADVRLPLGGPFSITTNLIGFENLLLSTLDNPEKVTEALSHLVEGQVAFTKEIVANGLDIAFFESAAAPPLISPQQFRDVELPALKKIMDETSKVVGHPVPCVIGGNTNPILDSMLDTGTRYLVCPVETDQVAFMKKMEAYPEVMVRINMDPRTITSTNMEAAKREVDRVWALAEGREKVCLGTGCLPYETDPEMVLQVRKYIIEKSQRAA
jgi:uroporphyrinogen-III decarboxylase